MIRISVALGVSLLIALAGGACKGDDKGKSNLPVVPMKEYSVGNSREWFDMEKRLAPEVRKSVNGGKPALLVEVPNAKVDESTYIEKIGLMRMDGTEITVTAVKRERNPLTYAYFDWQLVPWSGKIKAFVKWNKYDLWVKEIDVKEIPGNS